VRAAWRVHLWLRLPPHPGLSQRQQRQQAAGPCAAGQPEACASTSFTRRCSGVRSRSCLLQKTRRTGHMLIGVWQLGASPLAGTCRMERRSNASPPTAAEGEAGAWPS
jgi:hypothetical protein